MIILKEGKGDNFHLVISLKCRNKFPETAKDILRNRYTA